MKSLFRYIVCACCVLALNSCIKDEFAGDIFCRDAQLSLNIGVNGTRAVGDNDDDPRDSETNEVIIELNEDKIDNFEVFFYVSDESGKPSGNAVFSDYVEDVNAKESTTATDISVPASALSTLFASGDTCNIYVVANIGKSLAEEFETAGTALTIDNLKAYTVSANFNATDKVEFPDLSKYTSNKPQANFVMDSDGTDIVTKSGNNLSGNVLVTRAASKITFYAYIADSMVIDGDAENNTWVPQLNQVTVEFHNVVNKGAIDNGSDTEDSFSVPSGEGVYADIQGVQLYGAEFNATQTPGFDGEVQGVTIWNKVELFVPFYSYSNTWTSGDENSEPAIVLTVPWKNSKLGSETLTRYTYTIPVTAANGDLKLVRNKQYNIALRVGVLGDLEDLTESEFSYEVIDWVSNSIDVNLSKPTYLVVEKDYVEVFNENSYSVNYSSSDDIDVEIVSIIKPDYSAEVPQEYRYIYGNANSDSGSPTVDGSGFSGNTKNFMVIYDEDKITLSHTLDNDMKSTGFDYVPYTVKVKVTMQAGTKTYIEYITFKQYPAIYLYADTNASFKEMYDNQSDFNNNNNNPDNIFVNGRNRSSSVAPGVENSPSSCGDVYGLYYGSNKNPNQYVITISSLDSSLPYIIADSRSRTSDVEGLGIGTIASSYAVDYDFNQEAGKRQLKYYYRTIEDHKTNQSSATDPGAFVTGYNIAPKYRIASSYSVTSNTSTLATARSRCATYQENGYPAGRWRMPTYAEVAFICLMSNKGMIPDLFNDGTNYWCAHGKFYPEGNEVKLGGDGSPRSIRCVYDEWYWGSERLSTDTNVTPNYAQFVWGDMKIW